ncbi:MAG TPA: O-antigen polymerase [Candidatus Baltobacteraceae bacterium]|nr:O-antigen polymerase [Candidatus Baltobacteraceae bacterium]
MIEAALLLQVLVWLTVLGIFLGSGQASVFHPAGLYLGFHGLVFVARPLLVHFMGFTSVWEYMVFKPEEEDFILALGVSSVAMVSLVGACLYFGRSQVGFPAKPPPSFTPLQRQALIWTTLILLPYLAISIYTTRGGAETAGERASNGVFIMSHSTGYLNDAQFMIAPLLCAWLLVTRFHWLNLPLILIYVAFRSWTGWSRWTIVLFLLMVIFAYCWRQRRRWLPMWSILLAVPVLILFNILGHNRDVLKQLVTGERSYEREGIRPGMTEEERRNLRYDTQDFANFDYLCYIVGVVPKRTDAYTYGLQYLQLFTEPIPRILWSGKPLGAPVRTIDLTAYGNFVGLTVSLPGDGWISGGWVGVVITLSIVGWILGKCHRWFWKNCDNPVGVLFYVSGLAMLPQWYRDGGISIFKFLMWTWLPFLIWVGLTWMLGGRPVPGSTITFRTGDQLRILQAGIAGSSSPRGSTRDVPSGHTT